MQKFESFNKIKIQIPDVSISDEATATTTAGERPRVEAVHELVPDYFANVKINNPDDFLKYEKLCPDNSPNSVVPDYYVRHFDPVNDEMQTTVEKDWSFKTKLYEITEEKIQELQKFNIKVTPNDYEWVVDHFEKTAINDQQQSKKYLIKKFRERAPPDVSARIEDEVMVQIYDHCWKGQREKRCNRSFIRMFWSYQDSVGPDNYQTFKRSEVNNRPNVRGQARQKIHYYKGAF